ncbi:MAG: phenylalanine--tRNA ligase subunit beta [Deltaproteobacteria bacterium]|nr:phenylalanine--tRNA ligase subunit beta [Deltaproteobacteria bacterium]
MIADAEKAVALAGVMGGGNSEVSAATTALLLETAQFDAAALRRASKRHQKKTDSSHRFERQIDARAVATASGRAAALIAEVAGGKVFKGAASAFSPRGKKLTVTDGSGLSRITFRLSDMNRFLGAKIGKNEVQKALEEIGFKVERAEAPIRESTFPDDDAEFLVTPPSYRPDVQLKEDVYEEVLRVWGYDRIESVVPRLDYIPDRLNAVDARARALEKLKTAFVQLGLSETVNYAFTSKAAAANWSKKPGVPIANPLNEELTTMRTSLLSGLFENLLRAVHHQTEDVRLFEIRPVYFLDGKSETGVREEWRVAGLMTGRGFVAGLAARDRKADFYDVKGTVESALESIGCRGLRFGAPAENAAEKRDAPLHPAQTATVLLGRGPCGFAGRLHPKFEMKHKLRHPVYVFELDLERVLEMAKAEKKYSPISRFPKVSRDLSLLVPEGTTSDRVALAIQKLGKPLVESVSVVDLYRGEKIPQGTLSLSVSMVLGDPNRTLEEVEVERATQSILVGLEKELSVKLRVI